MIDSLIYFIDNVDYNVTTSRKFVKPVHEMGDGCGGGEENREKEIQNTLRSPIDSYRLTVSSAIGRNDELRGMMRTCHEQQVIRNRLSTKCENVSTASAANGIKKNFFLNTYQ